MNADVPERNIVSKRWKVLVIVVILLIAPSLLASRGTLENMLVFSGPLTDVRIGVFQGLILPLTLFAWLLRANVAVFDLGNIDVGYRLGVVGGVILLGYMIRA